MMSGQHRVRRPLIAALLYHDVVEDPADSGFRAASAVPYKHGRAYFDENIRAIGSQPVKPVSVLSLDLQAPGNHLLLTFDDGGRSAVQVAEILASRGWIGHFFITTNMIGEPGFVSSDEIRELARAGHVVGSHSHTHPNIFYDLSDGEMLREWRTSCGVLSSILGTPIVTASVPGGDMDDRTIVAAGRAGIRYLFTSEPTFRYWQRCDVTCLGRMCARRNTPLTEVVQWCRCRGAARQMIVRKTKQFLKRLLAPVYRARSKPSLGGEGSCDR